MGAERVTFERATLAHVAELAASMRADDRAEVLATSGRDARRALLAALRWSRHHGGEAWAGLIDGHVAAIFGVGRRSLLSRLAVPWCLTGAAVERAPRPFWRASQAVLEELLEAYGDLEQYVDARYAQALRWAARLGFSVEEARPFGASGLPFHRIVIRRSHV